MQAKNYFLSGIRFYILLPVLVLIGCNSKETNEAHSVPPSQHPDTLLVHSKNLLYTYPDSAYQLATEAEVLAKAQNNPLAQANAFKMQASYYSDIKTDYLQATRYCKLADSIYRKYNGKDFLLGRGAVYHNLGTIELRQGNYLPAIELYTKALHQLDTLKDEKTLPRTLNNLSTLFSFLKDDAKSEQYARECYKISKKNKDDYLVSVSSVTLASALINQEKYNEVPKLLDNAKAIALTRKDYYILDLVYLNYGGYYHYYKKDYKQAIENFQQASLYADSLKIGFEQMRALINLSMSYFTDNQFGRAETSAQKTIELARNLQSMDVEQRALNILAKVEARKNNFDKAYEYQDLSYRLRDTVMNENNKQHMNYLEAEFQNEKKELKIDLLERQKNLYRIINIAVAFILILLILILYLRQNATRRKKQLAEQKIIQLEQEKQLVATQAVLDGETAERTRLARDLHDGLGGMLSAVKLNLFDMKQGAIIETEDVSRFGKVIEMLDNAMQELRRVAHNMMPEALSRYGLKVALEDFCSSFSNVYFHFYGEEKRLDQKTETTLYRSVFELVNNAVKHAQAENINVQIIQQPYRISINVQDNGKGFDAQEDLKGSGLQNIKDRINSLGGSIHFLSSKENGTEIAIDVDLNQEGNGKD